MANAIYHTIGKADDAKTAEIENKFAVAQSLYAQLKTFGESIATDTSGEAEFDVEICQSIRIARACMLRWIAINSPNQVAAGCISILIEPVTTDSVD